MKEEKHLEKNPWGIKDSETAYDNAWIKVEEHRVVNPAGNPGIYGTVHFKNRAMGVIPLDKDDNTWIVGQYRFPLKAYSWEIPMGGGLLSEDKLEAVQRELKEECGITAKKWELLAKIHLSNSVTDEVGYIYIARDLTIGVMQHEDTEKLQIKKVPFRILYEMVMNGEITDSLSVAAVLKAAIVLKFI